METKELMERIKKVEETRTTHKTAELKEDDLTRLLKRTTRESEEQIKNRYRIKLGYQRIMVRWEKIINMREKWEKTKR